MTLSMILLVYKVLIISSIIKIVIQGAYTMPSNLISNQLPLGLQKWKILDNENCTDIGKDGETMTVKSVNFHKYYEMPGKFCCNNGVCIDSELGKLIFVLLYLCFENKFFQKK